MAGASVGAACLEFNQARVCMWPIGCSTMAGLMAQAVAGVQRCCSCGGGQLLAFAQHMLHASAQRYLAHLLRVPHLSTYALIYLLLMLLLVTPALHCTAHSTACALVVVVVKGCWCEAAPSGNVFCLHAVCVLCASVVVVVIRFPSHTILFCCFIFCVCSLIVVISCP
jgi:hypothetical protein